MDEQKERTVYIGIIKNERFESRTLVNGRNEEEAMGKVLDKYNDSVGVYFQKENVTILPFSEGFKQILPL